MTHKSTPLPWDYERELITSWVHSKNVGVASVVREENADFIVKAVNSHAALVEALKISQELLISLHVYEINDAHRRAIGNVIVNNAEAIKLAGES